MREPNPLTSGAAADVASMARRCATFAAALNLTLILASAAQASEAAGEAHQTTWIAQASAGLQPPVIDALNLIVGLDRRLLALRSYLRAGDSLSARWSWSQEQLSLYPSTPEGKAAAVDIDAVAAAFTAANPDFSLHVNRQVRSLELQISHWNENGSVGTTAAALVTDLERRFSANPASLNGDELRKALIEWQPKSAASLAAPGLSAHGQGRAFDFQVEHGGKVIAGPNVATAHRQWDLAGWTEKLHAAVGAAGNHFVGPIQSPYEPWHYAYTPVPVTSDRMHDDGVDQPLRSPRHGSGDII
jgi:D-alanyl-D-alanine carboxypeptidase